MVTAHEADELYQIDKYITDDIEWIKDKNTQFRRKIDVPVYTSKGDILNLRGNLSSDRFNNIKYSFSLVYRGIVPIRRWDYGFHNFGAKISHKHRWNGINDSEAYEVDDISLKDVNQALIDFLMECKIDLRARYIPVII